MSTENLTIEKEPSSFRLIATLSIAGFLSGVILVGIYLFTKPYIAQNKAEALQSAILEVLPNTVRFETMAWDGRQLVKVENAEGLDAVYYGFDKEDKFTGVAIPGEASGYQDMITALAGYNPDEDIIIGLKVLDNKETPGLGDKIIIDQSFQENFTKLATGPEIVVVKKGEKTKANEIEAITGATISSKAIGSLLQKSMEEWKTRIENERKTAIK